MSREDYISTNDAAGVLGVTRQRVLQLIQDGRLKAEKFANVYMIRRGDLNHIEEKPMGRPPKSKSKSNGAATPKRAPKKGGRK
jgi:excisionase family DNA binding protein